LELFFIDLDDSNSHLESEGLVSVSIDSLEELSSTNRDDTLVGPISKLRVGLARASLTIGKECAIEARPCLIENLDTE
jgi:hypothetical protein